MSETIGELQAPVRLLLTPGPSSIDPRVYRAMASPVVGHLDPWFLQMMGETQIRSLLPAPAELKLPS